MTEGRCVCAWVVVVVVVVVAATAAGALVVAAAAVAPVMLVMMAITPCGGIKEGREQTRAIHPLPLLLQLLLLLLHDG